MINNDYSIIGTIYSLEKNDNITNAKDPEHPYFKYEVRLEITRSTSRTVGGKMHTYTERDYPKFDAFEKDLSSFAVGDLVRISFKLEAKPWKKDPKKIFDKCALTDIRLSDLEGNVPVRKDATEEERRDAEIFKVPDPHAEPEDDDSLPF